MPRNRYTILSLSHAVEAAGFATACNVEPDYGRTAPSMPRKLAQKFSERMVDLRSVLASISIL
ncbi:MAG: hypothetical protein NVSMB26_23670 [Beijerinckiaceae bacterium]